MNLPRFFRTRFLSLLLVAFLAAHCLAQVPKETSPRTTAPEKGNPASAPPTALHPLTAADVEAFLDGIVPLQLQRENIAGAVVAVVKDGQILFEHGYGYSDVEKRTPVSVTNTLFRPGSISKLFTWTAVMQQVEQGKLDLDRDVNDYLDFKIPATFQHPITLRHLMTHTPGFEEGIIDLIFSQPNRIEPLSRFMPSHLPRRIFPPGTVPAYSNYGAALAGYIVERVSGKPYEQYIEDSIFTPLEMSHASFRQPLPAELAPLMSKGYDLASDPAKPFELIGDAPAGALSTSADDITHFIIAHLQDGRYGEAQILKPETARLMHSRQRTDNPNMPGMALGFYEENREDLRIIGHGGDTQWFHSDLHLIPSENVGLFVSYNSEGKGEASLRDMLWQHFLNRYFIVHTETPPAISSAAADAKAVTGTYLVSRRCDDCIVRLANLIDEATVSSKPDGTITVDQSKYPNGQPRQWREIAPFLYRDMNSSTLLAFNPLGNGRYRMVIPEDIMVLDTVPWYLQKYFVLSVVVGTFAVFALSLLFWPISALVRRHYGRQLPEQSSGSVLRIGTRVAIAIDLLVLAAWFIFFSLGITDLSYFSTRSKPWLHLLQVITVLGIVATIIPLFGALRAWFRSGMWWWERVWTSLILLACLGYIWTVIVCRFLDWRLRY